MTVTAEAMKRCDDKSLAFKLRVAVNYCRFLCWVFFVVTMCYFFVPFLVYKGTFEIPAQLRSWTDFRTVAPPLSSTIAPNDTGCGKTYMNGAGRDSDTESVNDGDLPWQAVIYNGYGSESIGLKSMSFNTVFNEVCEGSLISQRFVLTTAHCVNRLAQLGILGFHHTVVRLGDQDLVFHNERYKHQEFLVKRRIVHEKYRTQGDANDIALLELAESVVFNEAVAPICLRRQTPLSVVKPGQLASQSGWNLPGHSWSDYRPSRSWITFWMFWSRPRDLARFDVELADCRSLTPPEYACSDAFIDYAPNFFDDSRSLCGVPFNMSTRMWNSNFGGPLLQYSGNNGRAELIGITSAFYERPFRIVYTNIARHLSWIDTNMKRPL